MTEFATFITTLLTLLAVSSSASAGTLIAYDFINHFDQSKVTQAMTASVANSTVGSVQMRSIFLHPSAKEASAAYNVALPKIAKSERLVLTVSAGIRDGIAVDDPSHPFDGVKFTLRIDGKVVFTADIKETKWVNDAVDLSPFAGKQVKVVFSADPKQNSNYDWAVWGEPRILKLTGNVLPRGRNEAQTAKGLVVVGYSGANDVRISPTGLPAKDDSAPADSHSVTWSSDKADFGPQKIAVIPFDFTAIGAKGISLALTDLIGSIEVYEFDPRLEISSFGPTNALLFSDKETTFQCTIKNAGDGILHASSETKVGIVGVPGVEQPLGEMLPGEQKTISWTDVKLPIGPAKTSVYATGQTIKKISASWNGEVIAPPMPMPKDPTAPGTVHLDDGTILLQRPGLRIAFFNGKNGYAGWTAYISEGPEWKPAASGGPLGKVVDSAGTTYTLLPKDLKLIDEPNRPSMVFFVMDKTIGKVPCHFEWIYALTEQGMQMTHTMKASAPLDILHFSGPIVYAGDRGFGATKDEGLFPGLEYLKSESSSGTENAHPPYSLRTVPEPNKVTIPLMAVRAGSTTLSLEWNPLQKWDGTNNRPSALFASPNFIDGQNNHKMGIFVPSVPRWVTENQLTTSKPYSMKAGAQLDLKAELAILTNSTSVIDAVDSWIARNHLPDPPKMKTTSEDWLDLCDKAYFVGSWDESAKAWKHTNTGPTFFDPMIATYLLNRANYASESKDREGLMGLVGPAIEKAKDSLPLEVALLNGGVEPALERMGKRVKASITAQNADGSFPFNPDKAHEVFGKPGDTSSGLTAAQSLEILQYALITGDKTAKEAGLKALVFLDGQQRPEGAQTWELQLHVPDILASARLVDAYLYGYQITDDPRYLQRAVYWAKTGLPFVYLWNAPDRPIMRYGTIPVFGVTWFDSMPWFGKLVQWCGLDYASALAKLSHFDNTLPWMNISDGILRCAVQQQEYITKKYPADAGMYPDAFSAITGEEAYHWDLNPRLVSKTAMQVLGKDGFPRSVSVVDKKGNRITITAPANALAMQFAGETLHARIAGPPNATIYVLLYGVREPNGVQISDRSLSKCADLSSCKEGIKYIPDKSLAILKVNTEPGLSLHIDLTNHLKD